MAQSFDSGCMALRDAPRARLLSALPPMRCGTLENAVPRFMNPVTHLTEEVSRWLND